MLAPDDGDWLRELMRQLGPNDTAEEWIEVLNLYADTMEQTTHPEDPARLEIPRLRRIMSDPGFAEFLLDAEDRALFGESVSEMKSRFDLERN